MTANPGVPDLGGETIDSHGVTDGVVGAVVSV